MSRSASLPFGYDPEHAFAYDPAPLLEGEPGAGTMRCPTCGELDACDCPPRPRPAWLTARTTGDPAPDATALQTRTTRSRIR